MESVWVILLLMYRWGEVLFDAEGFIKILQIKSRGMHMLDKWFPAELCISTLLLFLALDLVETVLTGICK